MRSKRKNVKRGWDGQRNNDEMKKQNGQANWKTLDVCDILCFEISHYMLCIWYRKDCQPRQSLKYMYCGSSLSEKGNGVNKYDHFWNLVAIQTTKRSSHLLPLFTMRSPSPLFLQTLQKCKVAKHTRIYETSRHFNSPDTVKICFSWPSGFQSALSSGIARDHTRNSHCSVCSPVALDLKHHLLPQWILGILVCLRES